MIDGFGSREHFLRFSYLTVSFFARSVERQQQASKAWQATRSYIYQFELNIERSNESKHRLLTVIWIKGVQVEMCIGSVALCC